MADWIGEVAVNLLGGESAFVEDGVTHFAELDKALRDQQ